MKNQIVLQDFFEYVKSFEDNFFDLIIVDPPYNVNAAKWDNISNYLDWLKRVLVECIRVLKETGSVYIWGMSKNNDFLKIKLWIDDTFDKIEFKNWIVWIHEVKLHKKLRDRFLTKHEDLLFYGGKYNTFNIQRDDPPEFQLEMHSGRYDENFFVENSRLPPSQQKIFKDGLQLGSPAKSWWKGPSNQSNSKKIAKFAGYKSEWVCERIIKASSNKDDRILIPFAGSGTECVVAKKLDREFWSCEIDPKHHAIAIQRLENAMIETRNIGGLIEFLK